MLLQVLKTSRFIVDPTQQIDTKGWFQYRLKIWIQQGTTTLSMTSLKDSYEATLFIEKRYTSDGWAASKVTTMITRTCSIFGKNSAQQTILVQADQLG